MKNQLAEIRTALDSTFDDSRVIATSSKDVRCKHGARDFDLKKWTGKKPEATEFTLNLMVEVDGSRGTDKVVCQQCPTCGQVYYLSN